MFKWPDSATSPGSWHVAACGAAGRVTGASRPRDGARRTRRLDVFPSPPVRLHTRKRHTAPSVASGGDGTRRRGPGQHRGVDGVRGGLLWAVPRAGRPASCSQNTPRTAGKTDWTLGGQDADSDLRRRGPAASSGSGPPQTPGRCVRKAQPRGHTARHRKLFCLHVLRHPARRRPSEPPLVGSSSGRCARPATRP